VHHGHVATHRSSHCANALQLTEEASHLLRVDAEGTSDTTSSASEVPPPGLRQRPVSSAELFLVVGVSVGVAVHGVEEGLPRAPILRLHRRRQGGASLEPLRVRLAECAVPHWVEAVWSLAGPHRGHPLVSQSPFTTAGRRDGWACHTTDDGKGAPSASSSPSKGSRSSWW